MLWGWLLVGVLVLLPACRWPRSARPIPTAGGLYYWAAKLAPGNSAPIWSWFTGWFNLLGQVAVTAGISFGCAFSISAFLAIYTDQAVLAVARPRHRHPGRHALRPGPAQHLQHPPGRPAERRLGVLAPHRRRASSSSCCSGRRRRTPTRRLGFLFGSTGWHAFAGLSGFSLPFYIFLVGLLNAQYTFTGYDASAHVSEETMQRAHRRPRRASSTRSWVSLIAGFILLVGVSIAIPHVTSPSSIGGTSLQGYSRPRRHLTPCGRPSSSTPPASVAAELLILIVIGAQFYCGMSSVTANSRMIYAFSRDGAVPFSNYWHHVNKRAACPCAPPGSAPSARSSSPRPTCGTRSPTAP